MKRLLVLFLAVIAPGSAAAQARPALSSYFTCGCMNSKEEPADFDVFLASSVEKGPEGPVYRYKFSNRSSQEAKLLLLLSIKDRVSFIGEFINDTGKPANYRAGRGGIFIILGPKETKTFDVKDNSPNVMSATVQVTLVDEYDSTYAGHAATIYFPAWEHVFGK